MKPIENKIDDNFAKIMGAKDINDLKKLIEKSNFKSIFTSFGSITKKEILDQIEKNHNVELPKNLIEHEISIMTQKFKT